MAVMDDTLQPTSEATSSGSVDATPPGQLLPESGECDGADFEAQSQVLVVASVIGHTGASGVAVGVAGAAVAGGLRVRVIDAAPPRRAGLCQLVTAEGVTTDTGARAQIVTSSQGNTQVQYVRAGGRDGLDERCDRPDLWEQYSRGADVTVIDPGASVEDVLASGIGRVWMDPAVVGAQAWVVLVVPSTASGLRRTEAVLQQWNAAGLAAVAQVVVTGPGELRDTVRGQAGSLTRQALERSIRQPWHPQVYGLDYGPESLQGPLTRTGAQILTAMGGAAGQAVGERAGRSRHRLAKWRKQP